MPKVSVEHKSTVPIQDAMGKIKTFFETDHDIRRFDPKVKCDFPEGKSTGTVKGSQFSAEIKVHSADSGCRIEVVVTLPLLLSPFKGKVEDLIRKKLNKYLA